MKGTFRSTVRIEQNPQEEFSNRFYNVVKLKNTMLGSITHQPHYIRRWFTDEQICDMETLHSTDITFDMNGDITSENCKWLSLFFAQLGKEINYKKVKGAKK